MLKINLSNEIMEKIQNNYLKSMDLVTFILKNVNNSKTNKSIEKTSISNITINEKHITDCKIDTWKSLLIIKL
jgi:hypothetical protein